MNLQRIQEQSRLDAVKSRQDHAIKKTTEFYSGKRPSTKNLWEKLRTRLDSRDCANWSEFHREYLIRTVRLHIKK